MIETIGQAAGQVWTTLAQAEGPMGLTEVPKRTHLKTQIAYQALGWLAREGKVEYRSKGRKTEVVLIDAP
jgi:hypothetical protein